MVEEYDGTNFTVTAGLTTPRSEAGGAGTTTAGLIFAGTPGPGGIATTEEFTGASTTVNTAKTIDFD